MTGHEYMYIEPCWGANFEPCPNPQRRSFVYKAYTIMGEVSEYDWCVTCARKEGAYFPKIELKYPEGTYLKYCACNLKGCCYRLGCFKPAQEYLVSTPSETLTVDLCDDCLPAAKNFYQKVELKNHEN
jgi:hypothetical protein